MDTFDDPFARWFEALERRHLANLDFSEVRRSIQALSSLYVERRNRIDRGDAFTGAGKRAAFAMYFGPLHFLLVREIVCLLNLRLPRNATILDIGCGTGAAGAAWALASESDPQVLGLERNNWAVQECRWTYRQLGVRGRVSVADLGNLLDRKREQGVQKTQSLVSGLYERGMLSRPTAVITAFTLNELGPETREQVRREFVKLAQDGATVMIVEPIARRVASWWDEWLRDWKPFGVRADEWRFRVELPERLELMNKAAGFNHRELTGRSLLLTALAC